MNACVGGLRVWAWRVSVLVATFAAVPSVTLADAPVGKPKMVDRIIAVVNDEVITAREHRARLDIVEAQLRRQGTPLPEAEVLSRQVLERMVSDRVQLQQARELGIRIDDLQLDQAVQRIATGNNLDMGQFRAVLERDGVPFARFREEVRDEMTIGRLREREVEQRLVISDSEIDAFIDAEAKAGQGADEVELAHVLVRVPESASAEVLAEKRARAEEARAKLLAGEPIAQVAAGYSDAADALKGGQLGARRLDRLPALYAEAAAGLAEGGVSALLRSPNGFHVVKLMARKAAGAAEKVTQTRARHILIRTNELISEAEARQKLLGVRERLVNGGNFAELARLYSQDGSAAKGGELGWIYPGDTVPEFEQAMNALQAGELSQPVQSPFGWHLILVDERKLAEISADRKRLVARQALREKRSGEAYQDWLRQLRDRAYVDLRLSES